MKLPKPIVELVVSILALVISVAAAIFAWQQVDVSQRHNRVSVAPLLQLTPHAEGKTGRNGIYLSNVGLGPAIMTGFSVSTGAIVASGFSSDRWAELLQAAGGNPLCFATGWPREGAAIKAGDELPLVYITKAEGVESCYAEIVKLMAGPGLQVSVEYTSIYGDLSKVSESSKVNSATLQALYRAVGGK